MSVSKKFTYGLVWNFAGKVVIGLLGAVASILIARKLGKEGLGLYATIISIPVIIRLFTTFGFETILNVKLPALQHVTSGKEKTRFLVTKFLFYRIGIILIVAAMLYPAKPILHWFFKEIDFSFYLPYIILYLASLLLFSYVTMIFRALLRIKIVSIVEGVNQLLNLLLLALFFAFGAGVTGVLNAFIISTFLCLLFLIFSGKDFFLGRKSPVKLEDSYEIGVTAAIGGLIAFGLGTQVDIVILNYFEISSDRIGFYFLCFNLVAMMSLPVQGMGPLVQSAFSELYAREGEKGLADSWVLVTQVLVLLSLPIYVYAIFDAQAIIEFLYGKQYLETTEYFKVFAIFSCISILAGSSFCMPVFYLLRRKALALKIQFAGGILNLILNIILIPKYGVWGVVVATGFSMALTGIVQMLFVRHFINIEFPFIFELKILLASVLSLMPTLLVSGNDFIALLFKLLVYGIGFIALLSLLKPLENKEKNLIKNIDSRFFAIVRFF